MRLSVCLAVLLAVMVIMAVLVDDVQGGRKRKCRVSMFRRRRARWSGLEEPENQMELRDVAEEARAVLEAIKNLEMAERKMEERAETDFVDIEEPQELEEEEEGLTMEKREGYQDELDDELEEEADGGTMDKRDDLQDELEDEEE